MFMQQGGIPMNAVRPNIGGGGNIGVGSGGGGGGMPMGNFVGQGPNVLPGPLAFLEKTTSNIGKNSQRKKIYQMHLAYESTKWKKVIHICIYVLKTLKSALSINALVRRLRHLFTHSSFMKLSNALQH